jgi:hypothetical protein
MLNKNNLKYLKEAIILRKRETINKLLCNGQWQWVDEVAEGKFSNEMINLLLGKNS